jgi:uncharacterized protein (UPF0335 family)
LVDDEGNLTKIANRAECKGYTHKPVKQVAVRKQTEAEREKELRDQELYNNAP